MFSKLRFLGTIRFWVPFAALGIALRFLPFHLPHPAAAFLFGLAILGAAFLIAWTAEAAQARLKSTFIVLLVALIAVLPEYMIDMVFTVKAALNFEEYGSYPLANMTGANRLLIGLGWPLVYLIAWMKTRTKEIVLDRKQAPDVLILALATAYAFVVWLKGSLSLLDTGVFFAIFILYALIVWRIPTSIPEPDHGPPHTLFLVARRTRPWILFAIFAALAGVIYAAAEPFSEHLIATGRLLGIDEFILVQWLAPLASEAPEVTIAGIFAASLLVTYGFSLLLSSKINQWTLLVGLIPLVFALTHFVAHGSLAALPLDDRQRQEFFLTAAQSAFALAILSNLRFARHEAAVLFLLFAVQLAIPISAVRLIFSYIYLALAAAILAKDVVQGKGFRLFSLAAISWDVIRKKG